MQVYLLQRLWTPFWCYALVFSFLINISFSWTNRQNKILNYSEAKETDNCTEKIFTGEKGKFLVGFEEECGSYEYHLESEDEYSIINVEAVLTQIAARNVSQNESLSSSEANVISANISEWTLYEDGTKESILMSNWTFWQGNHNRSYLSRTPTLLIQLSVEGNWSDYELIIFYKVYKYEEYKDSFNTAEGVILPRQIGGFYRPNCVSVYSLTKTRDLNVSSIDIILHYLDIDVGIGEYLLIGAGKKPFEGPSPVFITSVKQKQKYNVDDENAYIVFKSSSTRKNRRGFKISWKLSGRKIFDPDEETENPAGEDVRQSMPICFYNVSSALEEFNKPKEQDIFSEFREKFAETAKKYAESNGLEARHLDIRASSVKLFRISGIVPLNRRRDDPNEAALYVMLKLQGLEKGDAAFTWRQLGEIIDLFEENDSKAPKLLLGYKVGKCPPEQAPSKWWNIGMFASIPLFCCLFLLMWAWKKKIFSEYCVPRKEKSALQKQRLHKSEENTLVEENVYVRVPITSTVPKVLLTTENGRKYTLDKKNSYIPEYTKESVTFTEGQDINKFAKRASRNADSQCRGLQARSHYPRRPPLNTEQTEDNYSMDSRQSEATKQKEHELEHVYDSVRPEITIKVDEDTLETKL